MPEKQAMLLLVMLYFEMTFSSTSPSQFSLSYASDAIWTRLFRLQMRKKKLNLGLD